MKSFGTLVLCYEFGWVTGLASDVQGKDGEKHHVHSALNRSFVAESRWKSVVGQGNKFHKMSVLGKK